jgi:hypothetical protein
MEKMDPGIPSNLGQGDQIIWRSLGHDVGWFPSHRARAFISLNRLEKDGTVLTIGAWPPQFPNYVLSASEEVIVEAFVRVAMRATMNHTSNLMKFIVVQMRTSR